MFMSGTMITTGITFAPIRLTLAITSNPVITKRLIQDRISVKRVKPCMPGPILRGAHGQKAIASIAIIPGDLPARAPMKEVPTETGPMITGDLLRLPQTGHPGL